MPSRAQRVQPQSRRHPPLSREVIVQAALSLIDESGDPGLTMRRLAATLDTGAASLYVYFRNTDELYAAVLDKLLGTVDLQPREGSWRDRLVGLLTSYVHVLYAHPVMARTALVTRPTDANSLNLWEALLGLLEEGGLSPADGAWAADLLVQLATAVAAEHGTRAQTAGTAAADVRMVEAVGRIEADAHPHLAAAADELLSGSPDLRLTWGFEVLINGILATPRPDAGADPR